MHVPGHIRGSIVVSIFARHATYPGSIGALYGSSAKNPPRFLPGAPRAPGQLCARAEKTTSRGFIFLRAQLNGYPIHYLNQSVTMSCKRMCGCAAPHVRAKVQRRIWARLACWLRQWPGLAAIGFHAGQLPPGTQTTALVQASLEKTKSRPQGKKNSRVNSSY